VVAAFDAGAVTSDAGALLLGATDRAINLMGRFAACFHDERRPDLIAHEVVPHRSAHLRAYADPSNSSCRRNRRRELPRWPD
jgi:hypothetical protein